LMIGLHSVSSWPVLSVIGGMVRMLYPRRRFVLGSRRSR
jgi:hypothetical protein